MVNCQTDLDDLRQITTSKAQTLSCALLVVAEIFADPHKFTNGNTTHLQARDGHEVREAKRPSGNSWRGEAKRVSGALNSLAEPRELSPLREKRADLILI
jgi:hypothetical protein